MHGSVDRPIGGACFCFDAILTYSVSSIHGSISDATTRRLGRWGFIVPAMIFNPSDNIALANCLASISVGNDLDCLGPGARDDLGRHWLGLSNETYQLLVIAGYLAMMAALYGQSMRL
jgi:hypothetical protein